MISRRQRVVRTLKESLPIMARLANVKLIVVRDADKTELFRYEQKDL